MRSTADHQFISTDVDELDALLVAGYEQFFGTSVRPGSPERLFISWIEDAIINERALNNHADNQNLPSRAEGENLDALAELFEPAERAVRLRGDDARDGGLSGAGGAVKDHVGDAAALDGAAEHPPRGQQMLLPAHIRQRFGTQALRKRFVHGGFSFPARKALFI